MSKFDTMQHIACSNMLCRDDPNAQALRSFCTSTNLVQLIGNPTRVTQTSESLIDVILVTNFGIVENSEVLQLTISDHFIVTVQLNLKQERVKLGKIMTRSYKNYKADEFKKDNSLKHCEYTGRCI